MCSLVIPLDDMVPVLINVCKCLNLAPSFNGPNVSLERTLKGASSTTNGFRKVYYVSTASYICCERDIIIIIYFKPHL